MAIELGIVNQDEDNPNLWYFQLIGDHSTDGTIRISRAQLTLPANTHPRAWLLTHSVKAQGMVDNGTVDQTVTDRYRARGLINKINDEVDYLLKAIAELDSTPPSKLRPIIKRLAQQNVAILRAVGYLIKREVK